MSGYTVHYQNDVWDGRPMAEPRTCRHPGMMAFPIGMRIEQAGGRNVICVDADICMDCGSDRTGKVDLVDGLSLAYAEALDRFARPFLERAYDLVGHRRADLAGKPLPIWMALALGLNPAEINEGVRLARIHRAAAYMGERMARLTEAAL